MKYVKRNEITIGRKNSRRAWIYKGKPLPDVPKTYKKMSVESHNIGNDYNTSILTIYKAQDGALRYEIYRDGSFYPYYGRLEFIEEK